MSSYIVRTMRELKKQVLSRYSDEIITVIEPSSSVESAVLRHMTEDLPLIVGFHNTFSLASGRNHCQLPTLWDFFLARNIEQDYKHRIKTYQHAPVVAVGLNAGFVANYLTCNLNLEHLFMTCESEESSRVDGNNLKLSLGISTHGGIRVVEFNDSRDWTFGNQSVSFVWRDPEKVIKRYHMPVDFAFAAPQYFPGIDNSDRDPYPELIETARSLNVKRLWLGHSSSARSHVRQLAKNYRGFLSTYARSRPIKVCRDSLEGAVQLSLSSCFRENPQRFGFEEEKGKVKHVICASYIDFA